jgi:hypothetical protein
MRMRMLLVLCAALALTIGVATATAVNGGGGNSDAANTAQVQRSPSMQTAERHGEPKNELPFTRLVAERATAQARVGGRA